MNRVYMRCPQCRSKECNDISCRGTGRKHKDAAPQAGSPLTQKADWESAPAASAPDIGYECAWPNA